MNAGNSDRPSAAVAATALPEKQGLLVMGLSRRVQRRSPSTSCACVGELERVAQRGGEPVGMERVAQRGGEPVGNRLPFFSERVKCWGFFWVAVFIERAKWAVSWALLVSAFVHDDGLGKYFLK